jgi:hypothetical protein
MEDLRRSGKDTSKVYHLLLVTNLKTGSFSKSAKAPLSIRLSPNVGAFAK